MFILQSSSDSPDSALVLENNKSYLPSPQQAFFSMFLQETPLAVLDLYHGACTNSFNICKCLLDYCSHCTARRRLILFSSFLKRFFDGLSYKLSVRSFSLKII
jgi:hypothetical protein